MARRSRAWPILTRRALNRATLARQGLLERGHGSVLGIVRHLVGLQAQVPRDPYVALWSRLAQFDPLELEDLLTNRSVARMPLQRGTIHLATARDCRALRPLVQPVLARAQQGAFGRRLAGVDLAELAEAGTTILGARPTTFRELRAALGDRWASYDAAAVTYSISYLVPLVQVPPRGLWTATSAPTWTTVDAWLGPAVGEDPATLEELVLRYLAAFGPASVRDVQAWCGLTRLDRVIEGLRDRLVPFQDERGVELFDLPDAPRPDPATPAPIRFLPQYDNVFLGHADRSRIVPDEAAGPWAAAGAVGWVNPVLVDGFIAGLWRLVSRTPGEPAALRIQQVSPTEPWSEGTRAELLVEGRALLALLAPAAQAGIVEFGPLSGRDLA